MYNVFCKSYFSRFLPEKRPGIIFNNPDLFIIFEPTIRFVIWQEILDRIDSKWKDQLTLWPTWLDFGKDEEDYDKQFQDYWTIELVALPKVNVNDPIEIARPLVQGLDGTIYINQNFVEDLINSGVKDVWYDTTFPYGRY
ncbi:hypothetical protein SAMN04488136_12846 [Vibrio xiamenensis]|uniref:Uncharacterized protein n=1 Tax=Vibrio xiamenensis TaxID=861298 RepID=A0A1G8F467_9VIBR|nr:hypothetical protein [Vibrio xiamenensis]SDH76906.1 hypothetical protein SAMN04488136_12846 [Vibrio xiamenensis]